MPLKTNYHTHNDLCDGEGRLEEYLGQARSRGFAALGFSSHAPLPYSNEWTLEEKDLQRYCDGVRALPSDKDLEVYLGLEIDYLPERMGPADAGWDALGLDYRIGSVHSIPVDGRDYSIDGPDEEFLKLWKEYYAGDALALSEAYYRLMGEMIAHGGFQILGHIDLVKKKNDTYSYLDEREPRYRHAVGAVLDRLKGSGIILEINSGGIFRGATSEVYPSPWILTEAFERDLPLMINADAHRPEAIDFHLEESRTLARESGYRKLKVLIGGQWRDDPL